MDRQDLTNNGKYNSGSRLQEVTKLPHIDKLTRSPLKGDYYANTQPSIAGQSITGISSPSLNKYTKPSNASHSNEIDPTIRMAAAVLSPEEEKSLLSLFSASSMNDDDSVGSISTRKCRSYVGIKYGDTKADPNNKVYKVLRRIGKAMRKAGDHSEYDLSGVSYYAIS
jgi:hypothetical protein